MIPRNKIESIIARHNDLEKELSSGNINSKTFPQKSNEYSDLSDIVKFADKQRHQIFLEPEGLNDYTV